jgi:methylenetetrahydrofolate dehydrogenase (NADP+)/methenyltetrahydrofolate cyclohydrolase
MYQLLDGKKVSEQIKTEIAAEVQALKAKGKKVPHLAAVLVGNDGASETYVASKVKNCQLVGFESSLFRFDANISEQELLQVIQSLNENDEIDGFIVQMPLPKHINADTVTKAIAPHKDVDGFHPDNLGKMVKGWDTFIPATPYGILMLLEKYNIQTTGKHCVVLGRSQIVGLPMSILMQRNAKIGNCTVTLCHSKTQNLTEHLQQADIIIAALGIPQFVKAYMVKEGAVVIDVGITRIPDSTKKSGFSLKGDVDFEQVATKCSYITPVPGGVGLMTIAALLSNTLLANKRK